jgi:predicted transglutaminase-like cysteine proteinase
MAGFTAHKALLALIVVSLGLSLEAQAQPKTQAAVRLPKAGFMTIGAPTSVPAGWADFCKRYASECVHSTEVSQDLKLLSKVWKQISTINKQVNRSVAPETDVEHWGVLDRWDYPYDGKGDCEDFALFKRKLLIEAGLPRQALLISVVKDEHNEGHAVLTLKTGRGEFVLDNLSDEIKPWEETGYRFVKRQSQSDENVWVQIGEPTAPPDYVSR